MHQVKRVPKVLYCSTGSMNSRAFFDLPQVDSGTSWVGQLLGSRYTAMFKVRVWSWSGQLELLDFVRCIWWNDMIFINIYMYDVCILYEWCRLYLAVCDHYWMISVNSKCTISIGWTLATIWNFWRAIGGNWGRVLNSRRYCGIKWQFEVAMVQYKQELFGKNVSHTVLHWEISKFYARNLPAPVL